MQPAVEQGESPAQHPSEPEQVGWKGNLETRQTLIMGNDEMLQCFL